MIKVKGPVADLWNKFLSDVYPDLDADIEEDAVLIDTLQEAYYCGAMSLFSLFHESFEVADEKASVQMLDDIGDDIDFWVEQMAILAEAEVGTH